MGPQRTVAEKALLAGVKQSKPLNSLETVIRNALKKKRTVHFLPQCRAENRTDLERWTGIPHTEINLKASADMIRAVVDQRSTKIAEEIAEIEKALDTSYDMYRKAMAITRPGLYEKDVAGLVEGEVLSRGSMMAFPVICTIHGETLHGHSHENMLKEGDMLVLDAGAESLMHYASDITRTIPVSGRFRELQRDIYNLVLKAQVESIGHMAPETPFKDVHMNAAGVIAQGMKDLGFMKGSVDDAVQNGAHALFFPHGLGHMLGLDVHDMEDIGENYVGYDRSFKRSRQFGLAYLRMARPLKPGHVMTVEPGIYFIPELINKWISEKKFTEFINYDRVTGHKDFGGIRIEDDVLVTEKGHRVLGKPIAKAIDDVEGWCKE